MESSFYQDDVFFQAVYHLARNKRSVTYKIDRIWVNIPQSCTPYFWDDSVQVGEAVIIGFYRDLNIAIYKEFLLLLLLGVYCFTIV